MPWPDQYVEGHRAPPRPPGRPLDLGGPSRRAERRRLGAPCRTRRQRSADLQLVGAPRATTMRANSTSIRAGRPAPATDHLIALPSTRSPGVPNSSSARPSAPGRAYMDRNRESSPPARRRPSSSRPPPRARSPLRPRTSSARVKHALRSPSPRARPRAPRCSCALAGDRSRRWRPPAPRRERPRAAAGSPRPASPAPTRPRRSGAAPRPRAGPPRARAPYGARSGSAPASDPVRASARFSGSISSGSPPRAEQSEPVPVREVVVAHPAQGPLVPAIVVRHQHERVQLQLLREPAQRGPATKPLRVGEPARHPGGMFWLRWNRLPGS